MTRDYVARLEEATSMKAVVKGIVTGEDSDACVRYGADAVSIGCRHIPGLAPLGQRGVETVIDMLDAELRMVMSPVGAPTPAADFGSDRSGR